MGGREGREGEGGAGGMYGCSTIGIQTVSIEKYSPTLHSNNLNNNSLLMRVMDAMLVDILTSLLSYTTLQIYLYCCKM